MPFLFLMYIQYISKHSQNIPIISVSETDYVWRVYSKVVTTDNNGVEKEWDYNLSSFHMCAIRIRDIGGWEAWASWASVSFRFKSWIPREIPAAIFCGRRERVAVFRVVRTCRRRRTRTVPRVARRVTASRPCLRRHPHHPRRRPRRHRASRRHPAVASAYPTTVTRPSSTAARCWAGRRRGRCRRRPCPSIRRALTPARTAVAAARPSDSAEIVKLAAVTGSPAWIDSPSDRGSWTGKKPTANPSR